MLLLHQVGSVKIGEVVRYTVTYTPSHDRILPSPEVLYLRVRNTSAVALRAAFVHGPYTLNVAAYPAHFDPNTKFADPHKYGVPEFEPMLKAAGSWMCQLVVPEDIRQSAGAGAPGSDLHAEGSVSWVVEIASQIIFSTSAAAGYEILLARDEKSLSLGSVPVYGGQAQVPQPGRVADLQQGAVAARRGRRPPPLKGVFSKAVRARVEDTADLWNTPRIPGWDDWAQGHARWASVDNPSDKVTGQHSSDGGDTPGEKREPKKVHLVVLTHGLHSNLNSDMLYLKESIDSAVRQAKIDARLRRDRERAERVRRKAEEMENNTGKETAAGAGEQAAARDEEEEFEDEEVLVRGFSGNATRTERGIKFLGKRMARYVLSITYPDQPFLPSIKTKAQSIAGAFRGGDDSEAAPAHRHSTIHKGKLHDRKQAFRITSISFVGHSLGGLVQTYAVAYIQKHSPQFFGLIRPINFIALASPLLGLSNENPLYVKFALDFGLVGRTGQDLGLTWRAPTIARSGWGALVGTLGESAHKRVMGENPTESKPLLRILPTGPAHSALKRFRNRTVYSNVVNDGIVPLRTSCLLFLDWQGLDRVEKARREAGLVETMVGFGWAELTGANVSSPRKAQWPADGGGASPPDPPEALSDSRADDEDGSQVPQPSKNATVEDDRRSLHLAPASPESADETQLSRTNNEAPFAAFFNLFKSGECPKHSNPTSAPQSPKMNVLNVPNNPKQNSHSPKRDKMFALSQTLKVDDSASNSAASSRSKVTTGHELGEGDGSGIAAPPRTTFFESAGDMLNPKLPTVDFLIDPSKRPRTIFHDRIYHPADIPAPPMKQRTKGQSPYSLSPASTTAKQSDSSGSSPFSSPKQEDSGLSRADYDDSANTSPGKDPGEVIDSSNMRVEEKIARAYHRDLSWRKVLVKLEPDAHNNIIVRRTFANAHGWPVIKHLVDAHFSDSAAARMRMEDEENSERARAVDEPPDETGAEIKPESAYHGHRHHPSLGSGDAPARADGDGAGDGDGSDCPPRITVAHQRTLSEAAEAQDAVAALPPPSPAPSSGSWPSRPPDAGSGGWQGDKSPPSQLLVSAGTAHAHAHTHTHLAPPVGSPSGRADSVTWSDRDFEDGSTDDVISETESSDAAAAAAGGASSPGWSPEQEQAPKLEQQQQQQQQNAKKAGGASSPLLWNWTEKIVGRGLGSRPKKKKSWAALRAAATGGGEPPAAAGAPGRGRD